MIIITWGHCHEIDRYVDIHAGYVVYISRRYAVYKNSSVPSGGYWVGSSWEWSLYLP
jgi:hypothetical protein